MSNGLCVTQYYFFLKPHKQTSVKNTQFLCVQITKHKARLLTRGDAFAQGCFVTGVLGALGAWREHDSLGFGHFPVAATPSCSSYPPPAPQRIPVTSWVSRREALRGTSCVFNHSLVTVPFIGLLGNHILGSPSHQLIDFSPPCLEKRKKFCKKIKKKKDTLAGW